MNSTVLASNATWHIIAVDFKQGCKAALIYRPRIRPYITVADYLSQQEQAELIFKLQLVFSALPEMQRAFPFHMVIE
jgi:hypothetical protein